MSITREPYIFVIFQGGGGGPDPLSPPPSGSAHAVAQRDKLCHFTLIVRVPSTLLLFIHVI